MGQKQLQRWQVMGLVEGGKITLKEALAAMGSSIEYQKTQAALLRQVGRNGLNLVATLDQNSRSDSKKMNGRN